MNKSELIEVVAGFEDVASKASAGRIVNALVDSLVDAVASGTDVSIAGLGTFHVVAREAREGRNPQNGETIQIPAKNAPKFRASSRLKAAVNA